MREGAEPEGEGDRDAGQHGGPDEQHEEHDETVVSDRGERRLQKPKPGADRDDDRERQRQVGRLHRAADAQDPEQQHQRDADRQRHGAPDVRHLEGRRHDHRLVDGVFERRVHDQGEEGETGGERQRVGERPAARAGVVDERAHAHVLDAPIGDDGAEHREPQEQDRGKLVRPGERPVEDVARDDAAEQDRGLDRDEHAGRDLDRLPDGALGERRGRARGRQLRGLDREFGGHHGLPQTPVVPEAAERLSGSPWRRRVGRGSRLSASLRPGRPAEAAFT